MIMLLDCDALLVMIRSSWHKLSQCLIKPETATDMVWCVAIFSSLIRLISIVGSLIRVHVQIKLAHTLNLS